LARFRNPGYRALLLGLVEPRLVQQEGPRVKVLWFGVDPTAFRRNVSFEQGRYISLQRQVARSVNVSTKTSEERKDKRSMHAYGAGVRYLRFAQSIDFFAL
jgi:hypothetical protein